MKTTRRQSVSAWLVTRHWVADHPKWEVAAILNPRLGGRSVLPFVEFLHLITDYTLSEQASIRWSGDGGTVYPAHFGQTEEGHPWGVEIFCGNDPFLRARIVDDLVIERTEDGKETATWNERARLRINDK